MSSLSVTTLRAWEVTGLLVIPALCLSSLLVGRKGTGTLQQCWGSCSAWCSAHLHEDGNALLIYFVPVLPTFSFKKKKKEKTRRKPIKSKVQLLSNSAAFRAGCSWLAKPAERYLGQLWTLTNQPRWECLHQENGTHHKASCFLG